jgi:hypothetical protein
MTDDDYEAEYYDGMNALERAVQWGLEGMGR